MACICLCPRSLIDYPSTSRTLDRGHTGRRPTSVIGYSSLARREDRKPSRRLPLYCCFCCWVYPACFVYFWSCTGTIRHEDLKVKFNKFHITTWTVPLLITFTAVMNLRSLQIKFIVVWWDCTCGLILDVASKLVYLGVKVICLRVLIILMKWATLAHHSVWVTRCRPQLWWGLPGARSQETQPGCRGWGFQAEAGIQWGSCWRLSKVPVNRKPEW